MNRLARFVRRQIERLLGVWHEGPDAPRRIAEEARLFRHHYPDATHDQWEQFATKLAQNAYRDAFVRGFQWNERCWPGPSADPEEVAAFHAHGASLGDGDERVRRMLGTVPRSMSREQKQLIEDLSRSAFPIRIEFEEEDT